MRRWALVCAAFGCEAAPATASVATTADKPAAASVATTADKPVAASVAMVVPSVRDGGLLVDPVISVGGVPLDPAAIRGWLQVFAYREWAPQTDIRATGEHGGERLYFNAVLTRSMEAGAAEHPIGSAAVRELYSGDLKTLKGFALMHKTAPSGPTGEGWYWYEIFGTTAEAEPTVAQPAARGCVGCHSHAVDFVHSPDTPREDPQPLL